MSNSVSSRTGRASARRAWLVCLGCGLALFTVMGLGINGFTVYQPYLLERFHLTNGQGSWITTVRSLFSLLSMLSADALCRRLGIRQTMTLGLGFFVVSYALFGAASAFPTLCACAALSGLAYGFGGMIPLTLALSHWFRDRRGLALGLAAGGSGLSTVLAPPLLEEAIQHLGLTAAFWLEGGVGILLTLCVFLLVRDRPEELGLVPYTTSGGSGASVPAKRPAPPRLSRPLWWVVVAAAFLTGGPCGPGFSHLSVLYTSENYDSGTVALLMSLFGLVLMLSKVLYGSLSDTLGSRWANWSVYAVFLTGFSLCCLAPSGSIPLAFAAFVFTALGMPLSSVSLSVWAGDLSAGPDYDRLVKWLSSAYMLGSLLTGPMPGMLADRFGSYVPAYLLFLASLVCSMALIQGVYYMLGVGKRPSKS